MTKRLLSGVGLGVVFILLLILAWLHFSSPIYLFAADLGRHWRNGEQFFAFFQILSTNYYSYTWPDFSAPCHHWGFGVLVYALWRLIDFGGLSHLYAALLLGTFLLTLGQARRASFSGAVLLVAILALPVVAYRVEIRPEGLSTFFLAMEFFLLDAWRAGRLRREWLFILPIVQGLWVNVHILFACGLLLIVCFTLDALLVARDKAKLTFLIRIFILSLAASILNPFSGEMLLHPGSLFPGYGYRIAENQNIFFMMQRFPWEWIYKFYLAFCVVALVSVYWRVAQEKTWRQSFPHLLLAGIFGGMGLVCVRFIAMAGFIFVPIIAAALGVLFSENAGARRWITRVGVGLILLTFVASDFILSPFKNDRYQLAFAMPINPLFVLRHPERWSGLAQGVNAAGMFFKQSGLQGPILNNFDSGGYLIYHLFPVERPFVDNRPEAYPVAFFQEVYQPLQEQEDLWKKVAAEYGFEVIIFSQGDQTERARLFIERRRHDPEWALVYEDIYAMIWARRGGVNQPVIDGCERQLKFAKGQRHDLLF